MFGISIDSITRKIDQGFAPSKSGSSSGWFKQEEAIMGTAISVELWSDDRQAGEEAIAAVMQEMRRIDRTMSPHKPDSELSRINCDAASRSVTISSEMTRLLARAAHFSQLTGGAFDITYAAVGRLFDYRLGTRPTTDELEQARSAIGYRNVLLDETMKTVRFARPGVCIDLGGFAKGYAVDNATAILRERGIAHANISAGGDSRVIGDRRGRPWMIGIRDPRRAGEVVAVLPLEDTSVSTSGDYERYFVEDGVRFHHLIDPATGQSPNGIRSATILAEDGLTTEALSKSMFVLGVEQGMKLIESQSGVDAVVVDAAGALHYSSGLLTPK
jgi:thiamine biosynthesis lipoprotein